MALLEVKPTSPLTLPLSGINAVRIRVRGVALRVYGAVLHNGSCDLGSLVIARNTSTLAVTQKLVPLLLL